MKLGIGSYSLTWSVGVPGYEAPKQPLSAIDLLTKANEHGISVVQYADNLPLHNLTEHELNVLISRAKTWGISIEVGIRGVAPDLLLQYLTIAQQVGSPFVRALITDADLSIAYKQIGEVLPAFERNGIVLAIENHGLHTTGQLVELYRHFDSPSLGCCLDTVNSFSALEAPDTVIRALAPYTVNLHLKDFEIKRIDHQMGFVIIGTPAGQGRLDWDMLTNELRANGRTPNGILELWTPFAGSVENTIATEEQWFYQSLQFLRGEDIPWR